MRQPGEETVNASSITYADWVRQRGAATRQTRNQTIEPGLTRWSQPPADAQSAVGVGARALRRADRSTDLGPRPAKPSGGWSGQTSGLVLAWLSGGGKWGGLGSGLDERHEALEGVRSSTASSRAPVASFPSPAGRAAAPNVPEDVTTRASDLPLAGVWSPQGPHGAVWISNILGCGGYRPPSAEAMWRADVVSAESAAGLLRCVLRLAVAARRRR